LRDTSYRLCLINRIQVEKSDIHCRQLQLTEWFTANQIVRGKLEIKALPYFGRNGESIIHEISKKNQSVYYQLKNQ